jgi:predicted phage terminase large subunit-like protein
MASGRLQQSPQPKGGGIFRREWFNVWETGDGRFPACDLIVASVDGAFTEKEENDPSAMVVVGLFRHPEIGRNRVVVMDAWSKYLPMHGNPVQRRSHEIVLPSDAPAIRRNKEAAWRRRAGSEWGLVEWCASTCTRFGVNRLLIENKASGITAAQELQRLYGREGWSVELCQPKGDKVARALSVEPIFAQGMIYAPAREWAETLIDQACMFPKAAHDDLVDALTQGLLYLRANGLLRFDAETKADELDAVTLRSPKRALYPV